MLEVEPEVFDLFRDIIPAEAMGEEGELEMVRGRSGCVPALRLSFLVRLAPRPAGYQPHRGCPPAAADPLHHPPGPLHPARVKLRGS